MNRPLIMFLILNALLVAVTPAGSGLGDPTLMQGFDRNACYSNCPCNNIPGMEQACADCKQQCDRQFWKEFDQETEDGEDSSQD